MTNKSIQQIALALFFSLSLLLSPLHELNAADDAPLSINSLQLSVNEDGNCTLTIDSREIAESHERDGDVKGEEIKLDSFGNAKVTKLDDGRLNVVYDFATIKKTTQLLPAHLNDQAKKQIGQSLSIDEDEGVLVLTPDKTKKVQAPLPRLIRPPYSVRIDLLGHSEGMLQLTARPGGDLIGVSIHGKSTPEKSASAGDVNAFSRSANSKQFDSLLKVNQKKSEHQEYQFKVDPDSIKNNTMIAIAYFGDLPFAVKQIEITAEFPPSFGIALKQIGNRIIAQQVITGSAAQEAGVRKGDVLLSVDGEKVSNVDETLKALSECELGKEIVLKVQRFGKEREIKVTPQ
ncbi:MAG: hypothetical protein CME33_25660 [Gimesia sp.]|uniref:PDZ domain-containing protein n=1 Tax=Gimesia sp. TaxID=2024833 RepID=UPI000C6A404D|nr:PDZ domain-containing protein [Gimesia sp.]MAX39945.1 hypothetical protein [Gimesia sp.]|tara:strand:- start:24690 stop:25727 length:1038 start_codon:yes stop_codon:yes gene_type:complete